jgi:hypothetical protein
VTRLKLLVQGRLNVKVDPEESFDLENDTVKSSLKLFSLFLKVVENHPYAYSKAGAQNHV